MVLKGNVGLAEKILFNDSEVAYETRNNKLFILLPKTDYKINCLKIFLKNSDVNENSMSGEFQIYQNYPNPFIKKTIIPIEINETAQGAAEVNIYNVLGEKVSCLFKQENAAGKYDLVWDGKNQIGKDAGSGIYFAVLEKGKSRKVKKILLVR